AERGNAGTPAWDASLAVIVEGVEDSSPEDAEEWLRRGFAWTMKSHRFWRSSREKQEPCPEQVKATVSWLKEKGLARKDWVKKFPEVVGVAAQELEDTRATAPGYLKKGDLYLISIRKNPELLGKNFDCLAENDSCQGRCARCWNT
ncbi:unnamed protein product, partial [Polarella glacialis]